MGSRPISLNIGLILLVIGSSFGLAQIRHRLVQYPVILDGYPSNKIYIAVFRHFAKFNARQIFPLYGIWTYYYPYSYLTIYLEFGECLSGLEETNDFKMIRMKQWLTALIQHIKLAVIPLMISFPLYCTRNTYSIKPTPTQSMQPTQLTQPTQPI